MSEMSADEVRQRKIAEIMAGEQEMSGLIMDLQYLRGKQDVHREQVKATSVPAVMRMRSSNHLMVINKEIGEIEARVAYLQKIKDEFMTSEGIRAEAEKASLPAAT